MQTKDNITPDAPKVNGLDAIKYSFIVAVWWLMAHIPHKAFDAIARFFAFICWHILSSRRKYTIKAVKKHLECSQDEAIRIARASFTENFRSFLEIFKVKDFSPIESIKEVATEENFEKLLSETGPIVITIAHIGSWELMAALMADYHPNKYKITVVRTQRDKSIDRFMKKARSSQGMTFVGHRNTASFVMNALNKDKALVAFLVDHNCSRREAVFLPFLNDTAAVNMGPAMLALRAKATVVPLFLIRKKEGGHILHVGKPLKTSKLQGKISERVEEIAQYYTDACASIIKKYPEQWFWMHKRWKTRPEKD